MNDGHHPGHIVPGPEQCHRDNELLDLRFQGGPLVGTVGGSPCTTLWRMGGEENPLNLGVFFLEYGMMGRNEKMGE